MKFLLAIALLVFVAAEAHHTASLRGPRFKREYVYKYDVEFNVTSGVLGLSSQVSKAAIKAEVSIYTQNERDHILKIEKVFTSGSKKAVDSKHSFIPMQVDRHLEDRLSVPIKFTLVNGEITSYTLSSKENLESKKIKRSILRSLQMHVPETTLREMESGPQKPYTYNVTKVHETGMHTTRYMITVSPYVEFPARFDVYNITRAEDFEKESYPSHFMRHNFHKQGCSEACRNYSETNDYNVGCPAGHEPHHTPIKTSFSQQHHLSLINGIMSPEIIKTTEVHVANMYDQDMEVLIKHEMRRISVSRGSIVEPSAQQTYTDLNDLEAEMNEKEIDAVCDYKSSTEATESAQRLLTEISRHIVNGEVDDSQTSRIGEKIILLKKALEKLSIQEFRKILVDIKTKRGLSRAQGIDKVKRQIWLDILPLVGTEQSVTFIVEYIKERAISDLMVWEVKEMLETLPQNIHAPNERILKDLWSLIREKGMKDKLMKNHLLHSAAHMTLGRVIREICSNASVTGYHPQQESSSWFGYYPHIFKSAQQSSDTNYGTSMCSEGVIMEIVQDFTENLKQTQKKEDIAVYLEALSQIGVPEVLPIISDYVYGTADNIQEYSPKFNDFLKMMALNALHNVVERHPHEVLSIVLPVYLNRTESPRVRNIAFNVLIKSQPSLSVLQQIAIHSWDEESNEVGSFVTSTLETFGNSSLPCMQPTAHRIKKVLPQFRRFDIGLHHSKNFMWTYHDEQPDFGLENHFKYILSNESIIPSALYHSFSYFSDNLRDTIIQMGLNIEGLTQEKVMEQIESYLGIPPVRHFDKRRENEIFGKANLLARIPEKLRFTLYKKLFYCHSFNYFDSDNENVLMNYFLEYIATYLKPTHLDVEGYLVKMFLPSSFHTESTARTLPYPVEFEMKMPIVFALHVKSLEKGSTTRQFHLRLRPSVYATKLYTNQIKNIGDCKDIGVYHEHKFAASYPFEIKFEGIYFPNVTIKYKIPELPKKILTYFSESGTYAAKKELESLPAFAEREPIKTLPSPFEIQKEVNLVGVPPLQVQLHTEDIALLTEEYPRSIQEAVDIAVRRLLNAGWRHKSINITALEDSKKWPSATEVTFTVRYSRDHVTKNKVNMNSAQYPRGDMKVSRSSQRSSEWVTEMKSQEDDWLLDTPLSWFWQKDEKDSSVVMKEVVKAATDLISLPHIQHLLKIQIETQPVYTTAFIKAEYNHTYSKLLNSYNIKAAVRPAFEKDSYQVNLNHFIKYMGLPNEFRYDTHSEEQVAEFITSFGLHKASEPEPFKNADIFAKGIFKYESLEKLLKNELMNKIDSKYYLPDTHVECLKDVREGQSLSTACLKAMRERSIYNKLEMSISWDKDLPEILRKLARRADIYTKHYLFHHMNLTDDPNTENKINIVLNHIEKFTDTQVFDVKIEKPSETIQFRRVPATVLQPMSSVYSKVQTVLMKLSNNTYPPTCVMMEKYVKTYDTKIYPFSPDTCKYVLSAHCAEYKNFAVLAKNLNKNKGTKEVEVYVGNAIAVLTPRSGKDYKIKFNGEEYTVGEPIVLDNSDAEIYAYTESYANEIHLHIRARKAGIRIQYDGVNVKVTVDPRYKGELCGLCSEFDGEVLREYRGLDRCLYTHPLDFANSAITNREGQCDKNILLGKKMCDDNENSFKPRYSNEHVTTEDYYTSKPILKRNIVENKGNKFCFSTVPIPVCNDYAQPSETEPQKVAFHCLSKRDVISKKLFTESKHRILQEMASKETDYEEIVEVAKRC